MAVTISPRLTLPHLLQAYLITFSLLYPATHAAQDYFTYLIPRFYAVSCPRAEQIVESVVAKAVMKEARMAASLLRLHFHDCFVQGCDASILLDESPSIMSEKRSNPNINSARGFEVVDEIKSALEKECPKTVSCADILAIAARDSVVLTGGLRWEVLLGRRDSRTASLSGSNNDIPAPNSALQTRIDMFQQHGLNVVDMVALSEAFFLQFRWERCNPLKVHGSHTIGLAKCANFRQRLYNQSGNGQPDSTLDTSYYARLRSVCPQSGGDNNLSPLDLVSPAKFDNQYFKNLLAGYGLLNSDEDMYTKGQGITAQLVQTYAGNQNLFFIQFAGSMVKVGNISPLIGSMGEIRVNCRTVNS